ncbi:DUF6252 family protein [Flavobacterium capsici]|uniref:DUF6252 family protein n=1 Tax=Flavobacterium capsici TaxID=3075618 RepID=A0AA96EUL6_9FLAO|nr:MULTISPECIES: DUF6252 family protein [unclassified Flavobacterium]WNM18654.1 DUF6252 family protein [Flavobacterium sp. PMR2A8]WNM22705.1 DUF6252 family protein [Flavobacterium sp. PMTSA4]
MKNIKIIGSLLLLFTAITFTSCDNEPIDPAINLDDFGGGNTPGVFTAKIGSENFNANQLIDADYTDTSFGTQLSIVGLTSTGKTMTIIVMNPTVGTRTASSNLSTLLSFDYAASANDMYSSLNASTSQYNGTLTITEFNLSTKKISGTFSYTGYGVLSSTAQIQVTEGVLSNITFTDATAGGNSGGGNNNPPAVFKADFNNSTWTATQAVAEVSPNFIQIAGLKANGENFLFLVEAVGGVGTYPANVNILAYTPPNSEYGYWSVNTNNPTENTGSITITNINTTAKTISGTFNFKGYWSDSSVTTIPPVQFTNGVFTNIPYTDQASSGDSFYAKVNGTEFVDVDLLTLELGINGQDYISIGAQDAAFNSMTVSVRTNLGAGSYTITGNDATDVVQIIYSVNDIDYKAVSGNVTITEKTATRIKGTFNGVTNGSSPFTITQGTFDVEY